MKSAIIANRKFIIDDLKNMFNSKLDYKKFLKNRATEDVVFEDPLERFEGAENVGHFFSMVKYFDNFEFKIHNEVHSAHEALLDWDIMVRVMFCIYSQIFSNFKQILSIFSKVAQVYFLQIRKSSNILIF